MNESIARSAFVSLLVCASTSQAIAQTSFEQFSLDPLTDSWVNYAGWSVAIAGDRIISSAQGRVDPESGFPIGDTPGFAFIMDSVTGQELLSLVPSNGKPRDFFGFRVAAHGERGLVSSLFGDGVVSYSGAAYVFDLQSGQQTLKLQANDGVRFDGFGMSLDLDGERAIVGALGFSYQQPLDGAAYLFDLNTGQQLHKFTAPAPGPSSAFGNSVAIDGEFALVGYDLSGAAPAAEVFVFDTNTGQLINTLSPSAPAIRGEAFGFSLDLVGTTAFVGAPLLGVPEGSTGPGTGSVYLFDIITGQELRRVDAGPQGTANSFGSEVSAGDDRLIVGARSQNTSGPRSGAAYVFEASTGQLLTSLISSDSMPNDSFGASVDYEAGKIVVGAPISHLGGTSIPDGGVYVFDDSSSNSGQGYCFGDGSGAACPCGAPGELGQGCRNSTMAGGRLFGAGHAQVGADEFRLSASQLRANSPAVFFQGSTQQVLPLGEGLLCTTVTLRHPVQMTTQQGTLSLEGLGAMATPGATINYQLWYRDSLSFCGMGGYNLSNAWVVTW